MKGKGALRQIPATPKPESHPVNSVDPVKNNSHRLSSWWFSDRIYRIYGMRLWHELDAGSFCALISPFLGHLAAEPTSSSCHGLLWIGRRMCSALLITWTTLQESDGMRGKGGITSYSCNSEAQVPSCKFCRFRQKTLPLRAPRLGERGFPYSTPASSACFGEGSSWNLMETILDMPLSGIVIP